MPGQDTERVLAAFRAADPGKQLPAGVHSVDEPVVRPVAEVMHTLAPNRTRHLRALLSAAAVVAFIAGLAVFLTVFLTTDRGRNEAGGPPPVPTPSRLEHGTGRHAAEQLVHRVAVGTPQPSDRVLMEAPGSGSRIAHPAEAVPRRNVVHAVVYAVSQRPAAWVISFFDRAVPSAPIAGLQFRAASSSGSSDGVLASGFVATAAGYPDSVHLAITVAHTAQGSTYRIDAWTRLTTIPHTRGRSR